MSRSFSLTAVRAAAGLLGAALFCASPATRAASHLKEPAPLDAGAAALARGSAPVTVTLALKLRDRDGLESLVQAMHTPGSAQFHKFISPEEFHARFSPDAASVAQAVAHFKRAGLSAELQSGHLLKVTGQPDAIDKAFSVKLHLYDVPARSGRPGYRFHAPVGTPQIASAAVAANVEAIIGLDNGPRYRPHVKRASDARFAASRVAPASAPRTAVPSTSNPPGDWTVTDAAQYYNITPLYDQGYHGEGRTIGIVTLAAFTPSDAYLYWDSVGLATKPNRIKVVDIDGGPGPRSDDSGSDETTLDVQQSGGIAPAAKIIVYQAPNESQAFLDAFAKAINDNKAETLSVSWGEWEWFDTFTDVTIGRRGRSVDILHAFSTLFLQAAAQGQSLFASSGDAGAYDVNGANPPPGTSKVLGVDSPSSSPWITSAGGTTLPGAQQFAFKDGSVLTIDVPRERVWGWDYLQPLCAKLGTPDPVDCGTFPVGGGGGVSAYLPMPFYQDWVSGIKKTEPGQVLIDYTVSPPETYVTVPAHYRGRNAPDVSLNADPETGYTFVYTDDTGVAGLYDFNGGTSFVAPQLNGIAALLGQRVKGRLGLLNIPLYAAAATPFGYFGAHAPLNDIKAGDNWFYKGHEGYDQGSGVGTLNVANFAKTLLLLGY